jgi:hypothetical protein
VATEKTSATLKEQTMKTRKIAPLAAMSALALSFLTAGCDRTVSHTESEKVKSDGTVEKKEKTVTESPDGTIKKEEKKSTEKP